MTAYLERNCLQSVAGFSSLVLFERDQNREIKALIDFDSKVHARSYAFAAKLGSSTLSTDIDAQKINGFTQNLYAIAIAGF